MKRIRGHDIFKRGEPEKLDIEIAAGNRAMGFVSQRLKNVITLLLRQFLTVDLKILEAFVLF